MYSQTTQQAIDSTIWSIHMNPSPKHTEIHTVSDTYRHHSHIKHKKYSYDTLVPINELFRGPLFKALAAEGTKLLLKWALLRFGALWAVLWFFKMLSLIQFPPHDWDYGGACFQDSPCDAISPRCLVRIAHQELVVDILVSRDSKSSSWVGRVARSLSHSAEQSEVSNWAKN